jgi:hypothetical protein
MDTEEMILGQPMDGVSRAAATTLPAQLMARSRPPAIVTPTDAGRLP